MRNPAVRARRRPLRAGSNVVGLGGRARADLWPLLTVLVLVAVVAFLAAATPNLLRRAADEAVRRAVTDAGANADVVVTAPFPGAFSSDIGAQDDPAAHTVRAVERLVGGLEPRLASAVHPPTATVATVPLFLWLPIHPARGAVHARLAWLWQDGEPPVTWVAGVPPSAGTQADVPDGGPVQVAFSEEVAATLGVAVGDRYRATSPSSETEILVTGVFRAGDPKDPVWAGVPGILDPRTRGAGPSVRTDVGVLVSADSLPSVRSALERNEVIRTIGFGARADGWTAADATPVAQAVDRLRATRSTLGLTPEPNVSTRLSTVLRHAEQQVQAARALAAVLLSAVVVSAALALLLTAQLITTRRTSALTAARVRGGSLLALGSSLLLESAAVTSLGAGVGVLAAQVLVPGPVVSPGLMAVLLAAVVAAPVSGMFAAAATTGGRQVPANRQQRDTRARDRRLRRLALELLLLAGAVSAFATLHVRGVLPASAEDGGDLLAATAPVLGLLAGAVLAARLLPFVARLVLTRAAFARSAVPLLAAVRAAAGTARAIPLVALTLISGTAAFAATLAGTVSQGQADASWTAVGADVTLAGVPDPGLAALADRLAEQDGVDAAVPAMVADDVQLSGDVGQVRATVIVVDPDALAALTRTTPLPDIPDLTLLSGADEDARALVSADLPGSADVRAEMRWGNTTVPFVPVGRVPALRADGAPIVILSADAPGLGELAEPNTVWVVGDRADRVVATSTATRDGLGIRTRDAWLAEQRAAPLPGSLSRLITGSAFVQVILSLAVVLLVAQTTAPERGRMLALLRTLGLTRAQSFRINVGELLPSVVLTAVFGTVLGTLIAWLSLAPLELRLVTGQLGTPTLVVPWAVLAIVAPLAVAVLAVVVAETSARGRERLGDVLRIGGR